MRVTLSALAIVCLTGCGAEVRNHVQVKRASPSPAAAQPANEATRIHSGDIAPLTLDAREGEEEVPSAAHEITRFAILGVEGLVGESTIALTLQGNVDLTSLAPTIEQTGVSVSPASDEARDFTNAVDYVVTAEDGSTRAYTVVVTREGADAIDLNSVAVFNSPEDVASWPVTTQITRLEMQPGPDNGLFFDFPARDSWPDVTPPGWDGALQYTVWAVVNVDGAWSTSGYIQMWRDRASTGAPLLTDFAINWAYDGRWGPMAGHQPQPGELMGFFVTAGNARGEGAVTSVRERSNVVMVALPEGDTGVFTF